MNDQACNKSESKALDEFTARIIKCTASLNSRVTLVGEITDRLNGPEPQDECEAQKSAEPQSVFDKLDICISDLERDTSALESKTDRLNRII